MESSSLETQILNLGQKKQLNALKQLIQEADIKTIYEHIKKLITYQKFIKYLGYVLDACQPDERWAHKKKLKVIEFCLLQIQEKHEHIGQDILEQIIYTLRQFIECLCYKPEHLDRICNLLIEKIENGPVGDTSWVELLPEILRKICTYEKIEYEDDLINTEMYSTLILKKILGIPWRNEILIALVSMFLNIKLTAEENQLLLQKVTGRFGTLEPETIPPLIYRLLELNINDDLSIIFIKLQLYYGNTLYVHGSFVGSVYSESVGTDISNESFQKLLESERTTLYHIINANDKVSVQKYIKYLTNSYKLPENVLHPFNLTLLIRCVEGNNYIFNGIKSAMLQYFIEEDKRKKLYFKVNASSRFSLSLSFKQVIELSLRNNDNTIDGLIEFAFILYESIPPLGRDIYYHRLYKAANFILISILEKETKHSKVIIENIANAMDFPQYAPQIIDIFTIIGMRFAYSTLENISIIMPKVPTFFVQSNHHVISFIEVLINLVKHKNQIMIDLINQLKQLLHSSCQEKRINAVTTYIKLIKHLKINSSSALSQTSSGSYSVSTQIGLSRLSGDTCIFSNEAICLDIINQLKQARSSMLPDIKQHVYKLLPEVSARNKELAFALVNFLVKCLNEFQSKEDLPPLAFHKCCKLVNPDELKHVDSLSQITLAIALILFRMKEVEDSIRIMFDDIADKMINCDVEHFLQNQDIDLLTDTPEAQRDIYIISEALAVYEALMCYYILQWKIETDDNNPNRIKGLFKGYKRLADYINYYTRSKKKSAKTNTTLQSQSSTSNMTRNSNKLKLKVPNSIIPLECFDKIIELLYCEEVTWTSSELGNILKSQVSFHNYILESLIPVIQNCNQIKDHLPNAHYYKKHLESLNNTLFERCIKRYKSLMEFDTRIATQTLEAFYQVESTKQQIKHLWEDEKHSQEIEETQVEQLKETEELVERLTTIQALFESLDIDEDDDDSSKTVSVVANILGVLIHEISNNNVDQLKIVNWLMKICREKTIQPKATANNFIGILLNISSMQNSSLNVIRLIVGALCSAIGFREINSEVINDTMDTINETNAPVILQTILVEIKTYLDDLDWIIARIDQEYKYFKILRGIAYEDGHEDVKRKERNVCRKLTEICTVLSQLNQLRIITGTQTNQIIKTNTHFLNTLTTFGKYFYKTSTATNLAFQNAGYDGVVRTVAKVLIPIIYEHMNFIKQNTDDEELFKRPADRNKALVSTPALIQAQEHLRDLLRQLSNRTKVDIVKYIGMKNSGFRCRNLQSIGGGGDESDEDDNTSNQVNSIILDSDSNDSVVQAPQERAVESNPESEEEVVVPTKKQKRSKK